MDDIVAENSIRRLNRPSVLRLIVAVFYLHTFAKSACFKKWERTDAPRPIHSTIRFQKKLQYHHSMIMLCGFLTFLHEKTRRKKVSVLMVFNSERKQNRQKKCRIHIDAYLTL